MHIYTSKLNLAALGASLVLMLLSPNAVRAEIVPNGQARAVYVNVLGSTSVLADTGTLEDAVDFRENALTTGTVTSVLSADVLHAATTSGVDEVDSDASLADLRVGIAGITVTADFVMSQARSVDGAGSAGSSDVQDLFINGLPTLVTGAANQVISLVGGRVIINEQLNTPGGVTVNALRIVVDGVANLVIASATAGIP